MIYTTKTMLPFFFFFVFCFLIRPISLYRLRITITNYGIIINCPYITLITITDNHNIQYTTCINFIDQIIKCGNFAENATITI